MQVDATYVIVHNWSTACQKSRGEVHMHGEWGCYTAIGAIGDGMCSNTDVYVEKVRAM